MQCKAIKTAFCFLALTALLNAKITWADNWKLEKHKNNVSIYSKLTDSGYKEIWVKAIVDADPHALIALLDDVAFSSKWIHNCLEVQILDEVSPTERLVNTFFAAPWPVKDRDMVTFSTTTFTDNSVQIKISDRGNAIPHHPKYVRMQNMHGLWEANALENGKSEITYVGGGNPSGKLPTFFANRELIISMFQTFQNLSKVILLDEYQPIATHNTSK
jgi:hypothetical protein